MYSPPVGGNLKDRIAALQQRSVSAPIHAQPTSAALKSGAVSNAGPTTGSLRSKIAKFESKGGVPIPRGSFGMGAPPEQAQGHSVSRELYGNRIGGVNKPSGSLSRSGSPLPSSEESPGSTSPSGMGMRRLSTGYYNGLPIVDLSGVTQKLSYQALHGTDSEGSTPATELSASDAALTYGSRRDSLAALGVAGRGAASSSELLASPNNQTELSLPSPFSSPPAGSVAMPDDAVRQEGASTPSIVVSPEPSSATLADVAEALPITGGSVPAQFDEPTASPPIASLDDKPTEKPVVVEPSSAVEDDSAEASTSEPSLPVSAVGGTPTASPITPTTTGGRQALLEHPADSPYREFAGSDSPTSTPPNPTAMASRPDIVIERPARSTSLAAKARPRGRSPSPTPSMVHQPEAKVPARAASKPRKPRSASKARAFANVRRTMMELPANPPPSADDDENAAGYGSVMLGSHSDSNILEAAANKPLFSAVVHGKITEILRSSSAEIPSSQSMPMTPVVKRNLAPSSTALPPPSPGYGDLAALLEEAALLEAKLAAGEAANDIVEHIRGSDGGPFQLEPFSVDPSAAVPSITRSATPESIEKEHQQQAPTASPSKGGLPRMLSGIRRFTSSSTPRSSNGSHSRMSTSGSELSSEDSASVNTPSENGLPFPSIHPNGSRQSMSSALSSGHPDSPSSKKNGLTNRANSFWRRSRTKSTNSNNSHDSDSLSPRKSILGVPTGWTHTVPKRGQHVRQSSKHLPVLPTIPSPLTPTDATHDRPVSWLSQSSTSSTNTTSTVSPGLYGEDLFNAFPSVPQQVPHFAVPEIPFPRASIGGHEVGRAATLPLRVRRYSAQRIS
ncbi:hypothetical protein FIBSPDRAFT_864499 [Athelia psychrophila]|uniref:Uncharacterized protein n=1 Tax=Athelia psychrophila TaxID=1759441 RepID=A0A166GIG3_9AGAM|nr:hypothetical protein FIBSPDRAFT_864499 [Fibularhizoctonia sp. CBS 109695]